LPSVFITENLINENKIKPKTPVQVESHTNTFAIFKKNARAILRCPIDENTNSFMESFEYKPS